MITSLNTNGAGNVYLYQNFYHPTQTIPAPWTESNQAETCYAIQSISYDAITETYTVMVDWLVGQASFQDSNIFVWSENGPFYDNDGNNITTTTTTTSGSPCDNAANDGSVSVSVTNINSTSTTPFTTWTLELYDSTTIGSPSPNNLIYTDPNVYAVGAWSNTYVGLSVTPAGTTAYGIYYAVITDNNGCIYGPFVIRVNCIPEPDPCENYPGGTIGSINCCDKCDTFMTINDPCYNFCQQWGDCCDDNGVTQGWDCITTALPGTAPTLTCVDHNGPYGLSSGDWFYVAGGQYLTLNQCTNLCSLGASGTNWECDSTLGCIDVGIGNGTYNSQADCDLNCPSGLDCDDLLFGYEACADWADLQAGTSQYTHAQLVQHWYDIFLQGGYVTVGQPPVTTPLTLASLQTLLEDCCGGPTNITQFQCEYFAFPGGGYVYDQAAGTLSVTYNLSHTNPGPPNSPTPPQPQYAWQPGDDAFWHVNSYPPTAYGDIIPNQNITTGSGTINVTGLPTTPGDAFEFRLTHGGNASNPNWMSCVVPLNL